MKVCSKCNKEKELTDFHKDKSQKSGLLSSCKSCENLKAKKYRELNVEKAKEYYKLVSAKKKIYAKKYREANKHNRNQQRKNRKKTDPVYKFKCNVINLISGSFKRGLNNYVKSKRTEEILGCSLEFFQSYLKSQFKKGMTLENHGEWHIDHIKPIASATTKKQVIDLNHYTNFQPLWAKDNISKSDKIIEKQLKLL